MAMVPPVAMKYTVGLFWAKTGLVAMAVIIDRVKAAFLNFNFMSPVVEKIERIGISNAALKYLAPFRPSQSWISRRRLTGPQKCRAKTAKPGGQTVRVRASAREHHNAGNPNMFMRTSSSQAARLRFKRKLHFFLS
ncbi:MAG: hypothetical protein WAS49_12720, partial [Candidatus Dechloromonas phosphoritropha]